MAFGLTYIASTEVAASGNTITYTSISIGAADATRQLILGLGCRFNDTGTATDISTVTVDGNNATLLTGANGNVNVGANSSLWSIAFPTGTTATVVATYSNTASTLVKGTVHVYRMVGSTSVFNSAYAFGNRTAATTLSSVGLSIPAGGGAVGMMTAGNTAVLSSATNLTVDRNTVNGTTIYGAGSNTSSSGPTTMTFNLNQSTSLYLSASWATFSPGSSAAFLRTDADDSISDWTDQGGGTTSLYATIDETPFSDADYIQSPTPPNTSVARFRLSNPTTGKTLTDPVIVRYRFKKTSSDDQKLDVTLKQGSTTIATWQHTAGGLTQTFQTAAQTLTAPQLASISDFNSLYIEFQASPP